ncbi:unnamed protein product [Brassica oleracea var. botrytis]|uniref:(rape) hypothetical protein n=1 Tax=Brassica napus TaxID=3708 RepID=A0A816J1G1_BRANA|nr:unnamed protein product [Brassica napus]
MSQKAEADPQVTPSQGVLLLHTLPLHKISNTIFLGIFYLYYNIYRPKLPDLSDYGSCSLLSSSLIRVEVRAWSSSHARFSWLNGVCLFLEL